MISDRLTLLLRRELGLPAFDFRDDTKAFEVPGWDSLRHVELLAAIEAEYGLRFRSMEVLRLRSVGELQALIEMRVQALREDLTLVRREYPTDIGPIDFLCRDGDGRAVAIEVKRIGEIAGVDQLIRYQARLDLDTRLAPTRGMFVATRIKPQARVYAESRNIECVEIDLDDLRTHENPRLRLF